MTKLRIGLLNKKRGNFALQERFLGAENVTDETEAEVAHHEQFLIHRDWFHRIQGEYG